MKNVVTFLFALVFVTHAAAGITRQQSLGIAERYIGHRWIAEARHARHGNDGSGIEIHTPDRVGGQIHGKEDEVQDHHVDLQAHFPEDFFRQLSKGHAALLDRFVMGSDGSVRCFQVENGLA
jgi:hypothetical protein